MLCRLARSEQLRPAWDLKNHWDETVTREAHFRICFGGWCSHGSGLTCANGECLPSTTSPKRRAQEV